VTGSAQTVAYVLTKYVQPTQTFVANEVAELRRQGVEVVVVSVERGERAPGADERVVFLDDLSRRPAVLLRDHVLALVRSPLGYARFLSGVRGLRSEMGERPEQVPWLVLPAVARSLRRAGVVALHAHFAWSGAAAAELLAALTGRPWSVTLHAKDVFSKRRNLERKLARADQLVTVCRYNESWMREHLGLRRPVLQVVCGVELPAADEPRLLGADVVAVGRLVEKKGLDTLVLAAAELERQGRRVTVDVVGEGPERPRLERLVRDEGLEDRVRLLGARPHDEVLARIAGARVMAMPFRVAGDGDRDSMPVVVKEAMARRVPVVATRVAAVPEMLSDGCGVLVEPDDPRALADGIRALLDDEGLARAVADRAYQRVLERFTLSGQVAVLRQALLAPSGVAS
jgi:colanic acid/amylovoran biosynthesis glycosyltransferase